jgi:hypothetical protein
MAAGRASAGAFDAVRRVMLCGGRVPQPAQALQRTGGSVRPISDAVDAVREFGPERASGRAAADRDAMRLRDEGFAGETEAAVRHHIDFVLGEIHASDQRWWSSRDLAPWVAARAALMDDPDALLPIDAIP